MAIKLSESGHDADTAQYVNRLWLDGKQSKQALDNRNRNNYAMLYGNQWAIWNSRLRRYNNYLTAPHDNRIRLTLNKTDTIMEARAAYIIGDKPSIYVGTDSPETRDKQAAYTAQRVARADWEKHDVFEHLCDETWEWVKSCGMSLVQVYWKPNVGRIIGYGSRGQALREGELGMRTRNMFEYVLDPLARQWENVRYVICASVLPIEECRERYPNIDWSRIERISEHLYTGNPLYSLAVQLNSPGVYGSTTDDEKGKQRGIMMLEYFLKPCQAHPEGRYVVVVANNVIKDVPLEIGKLPFVPFYEIKQAGTIYGDTPVTEMAPIQENLNRIASLDLERSQVADLVGIPYGGGWTTKIGGRAIMVGRVNPNLGQPIFTPIGSYQRQDYLFKLRYYEEQLEAKAGVSSIPTKGKPGYNMSGRMGFIINEAHKALLAKISRRFAVSTQHLTRLRLEYINKFYTNERIMAFTNEYDRREVVRFKGTDIGNNYSVRIRLDTNMENPSARSNKLVQLTQSQLVMEDIMSNPVAKKHWYEGVDSKIAHDLFSAEQDVGVAEDENYGFSQGERPVIMWYHNDEKHYKEHVRQLNSDEVLQWRDEDVKALEVHAFAHLMQEGARKRYMAMQLGLQQGLQTMYGGNPGLTPPAGAKGQPGMAKPASALTQQVDRPLEAGTRQEFGTPEQQGGESAVPE